MKKILIGIAILVAILLVLALIYRDTIQFVMTLRAMQPSIEFADDTQHTPPDYTQAGSWAALPTQADNADLVPELANVPTIANDQTSRADQQANAAADVFFIHPTTYYRREHWNQPLNHTQANSFTDTQVLPGQASVFNGCCRVYAPRYRQATLYSFMDDGDNGKQAIDLAYADVKAAFQYYLDNYNNGRPFVIAGHSQGALHADKILAEFINDSELQKLLIAAYPVGYFLDGSNGIPVCSSATQTGCQVTWNSVGPDAPSFRDTSKDICVNPISWLADGSRADFAQHRGAVRFDTSDQQQNQNKERLEGKIETQIVDAQCLDGKLIVTDVKSPNFTTRMFGPGNYHVYDFAFYYLDIRRNVEARVAAYFDEN